jgi:NAD(P)-dependent dehydrogenase (short-subunit alcohol dehydrogenase family)
MKQNLTDIWKQRKPKDFDSLSLNEIMQLFNGYYEEIAPAINNTLVVEERSVDKGIIKILPAIRMILSGEKMKVASLLSNSLMMRISQNKLTFESFAEPVTPGELILSGLPAMYMDSSENILQVLTEKLAAYEKANHAKPVLIMIKDLGLIAVSDTSTKTDNLLKEFERKVKLRLYESSFNFLDSAEKEYLSKLRKAETFQSNGKVSQKVIVITGGAQGFGKGIAEDLFKQKANLVIADINETIGTAFAEQLNTQSASNQAVFVKTDVSVAESVQNLVFETVKHFGGLDVFISNAGILRAGGLEEMTPEIFDMVTKVNYNGYFLSVKYASEVMMLQSKYIQGYFTDIIQINSKSGLKGSNKNFAYAGGKFGGIGLTQSFAMELMPFNIKVNSICPGNFFDGPLWSDPNNGLFLQYLNAGKVPGAKTIEDVKKFYEAQVPAKRGCTVSDVMKAIYYIIDQEYDELID